MNSSSLMSAPSVDLTEQFFSGLKSSNDWKMARAVRIIPGYFSTPARVLGNYAVIRRVFAVEYFHTLIQSLRDRGMDIEVVDTKSERPSHENVQRIEAALERAPKGAIWIGQSKGGVDLLHTIQNRPRLKSIIGGILFLQSPLFGTPLADWASSAPILSWMAWGAAQISRMPLEAVSELTTFVRSERMKEPFIRALAHEVPILSLAARISPLKTQLFLSGASMASRTIENDGIVPTASMIFPGAPFVCLTLDHTALVMPSRFRPVQRESILCGLLRLSEQALK